MGDAQHGWAAAEWLMMMRHLFVREESDAIYLGSGIFPEWIENGRPLAFGPAPVPGGRLTVRLEPTGGKLMLNLDGDLAGIDQDLVAAVPGYRRQQVTAAPQTVDGDRAQKRQKIRLELEPDPQ